MREHPTALLSDLGRGGAPIPPLAQDDAEVAHRVSALRRELEKDEKDENFRWIFLRYYRPVCAFLARQGVAADRCDDLTQEVFLRVYRSIGTFRGDSRFETWLFRIAWNLWSKTRRGAAEREVPLDDVVAANAPLPAATVAGSEEGPLAAAIVGEQRALLHQEVDKLPARMRQCLLLRLDQGLEFHEIATVMRISINAVKAHLGQAKVQLKNRLGERAGGQPGRRRDGRR